MKHDLFNKAFILTGPTGSGKTGLGVELAERLGAEIISMDSMALYRGLNIGTAKPGPEDRQRVPHHLIDVLDPWESASVAWWIRQAAQCCRAIEDRGSRVLFVGGTPLYLKALLYGLFDGPPRDPDIRNRLLAEAQNTGPAALHCRLAVLDPLAGQRLHPNDLHRVVRALEVFELTGRPISDWQKQWKPGNKVQSAADPDAPVPRVLWLDIPRPELYACINARVAAMIDRGLVDEVRRLRELPLPISREASQALGYKEIFAVLDGKTTLEAAINRIQTRSRNLAKRQITWFRHLPECRCTTKELTFTLWGLTIN